MIGPPEFSTQKKKYLVLPGRVLSKNDQDYHFIGADQLMRLYGVSPAECIIHKERMSIPEGLIPLAPDYHGEYKVA